MRLFEVVALLPLFVCGCCYLFPRDAFVDELLRSCHTTCLWGRGTKATGSRWYLNDSPLENGDLYFIEWRCLEDVDTQEKFFALSNDTPPPYRRRTWTIRFRSYEEMFNAVVAAIRDEAKSGGCFSGHDGRHVNFFMVEKIGFPENSPLAYKEYCSEKMSRCFPVQPHREGDRLESIPGYVQYYSGAAYEGGVATSHLIDIKSEVIRRVRAECR